MCPALAWVLGGPVRGNNVTHHRRVVLCDAAWLPQDGRSSGSQEAFPFLREGPSCNHLLPPRRYDPVTFLNDWAPSEEGGAAALPSWDPLQRLRAMRKGGGAGAAAGAQPGGLQLSFNPAKYDAVSQLWEFLVSE